MANELTLPASFGKVPAAFAGVKADNDELGSGISASYGVIGYKGKTWSTRYQGQETVLMRPDGDGPRNSIEVVLVKASPAISKIFYKSGYVEGSTAAPDCWSADGVKPDGSVQTKMNATCADCPMNAWGSRTTEAGKQGKACADSRRVAVVPLEDIDNDLFGGPMLLRIPAASLKDLKAYGDLLNSYQYPYYAAATRVAFDPKEAYPKFVFTAIRPLTDVEANKILALRDDRRVATVLNETAEGRAAQAAPAAAEVPKSPFEQPVPSATAAPVATPATSAPAQAKTTAASPAPTPVQTNDAEAQARKEAIAEKKRKAAALAAEAARLAALAAEEDEDAIEDTQAVEASSDPLSSLITPQGSEMDDAVANFDDMLEKMLR